MCQEEDSRGAPWWPVKYHRGEWHSGRATVVFATSLRRSSPARRQGRLAANALVGTSLSRSGRVDGLIVAGHRLRRLEQAVRMFHPHAHQRPPREAERAEVVRERVIARSEERRVGKECRSRWSPY